MLRGRPFAERRWALAKRSPMLLVAGGFAGLLAGLLGITVEGQQKFQVNSTRTEHSGLLVAEAELVEESIIEHIPDQYYYMLELLNHVTNHEFDDKLDQDFSSLREC